MAIYVVGGLPFRACTLLYSFETPLNGYLVFDVEIYTLLKFLELRMAGDEMEVEEER